MGATITLSNLLGLLASMAEEGMPRTAEGAIRAAIALLVLGAILEGFAAIHHGEILIAIGFFASAAILIVFDLFWPRISGWVKSRRWLVGALLVLLSAFSFAAGAFWLYFSGPKDESLEVFGEPAPHQDTEHGPSPTKSSDGHSVSRQCLLHV